VQGKPPGPSQNKRRASCHERALGLLAVRQRSRRELEGRLRQAGYPPEEIDEVVLRLESVGLLDDQAFALALAEHRLGARHEGRRAVEQALASKGVDRALATAVLDELAGDEQVRADDLAISRAARLGGLDPAKAFQRLAAFLARRGYPPDVARSAARKALSLDSQGD
jgi:regulatory protein